MSNIVSQNSTGPNPDYIKNLFNSISASYDRTNTFITMGLHQSWRKKLIELSDAQPGDKVLDCATGTGDFAIAFKQILGPKSLVIGSDFCEGMLDQAKIKSNQLKLDVQFEQADVLNLQYEDNSFDVVSIGYGIRNVADTKKGIQEMVRVLKPGGRLLILETGSNQSSLLKPFISVYFKLVVPMIGALSSGNKKAYQYLNQSSLKFPCGLEFIDLMNSTDQFSHLGFKKLLGGASFIYKGIKR
ncbi:MAG: bifunctional demethylmenaquinone methyltransferase/2-methoxy-6-polyprenyl-1,4-benzoquinol methylase UbiE [Bdellovibrionales bacterium]|nr:bifunctional demethylmenaquinone methyltransferase/2-methoxy-6-polyprenyl-1,4-benzoquinol methylase UbiE [Bdellovibrionales bacterium]